MCVILHRPEGVEVDWEDLVACYEANPDGCGLMWFDGPNVRHSRGLWTDDEFLDRVYDLGEREYVLHLRWGTHGSVCYANCHPFPIGGGGYVVHNGILSIKRDRPGRSDTWHFARNMRRLGYASKLEDERIVRGIERAHGAFNKLAFALPGGRVIKTGRWQEYAGCQWSNLNWQAYLPRDYRVEYDDDVVTKWWETDEEEDEEDEFLAKWEAEPWDRRWDYMRR